MIISNQKGEFKEKTWAENPPFSPPHPRNHQLILIQIETKKLIGFHNKKSFFCYVLFCFKAANWELTW